MGVGREEREGGGGWGQLTFGRSWEAKGAHVFFPAPSIRLIDGLGGDKGGRELGERGRRGGGRRKEGGALLSLCLHFPEPGCWSSVTDGCISLSLQARGLGSWWGGRKSWVVVVVVVRVTVNVVVVVVVVVVVMVVVVVVAVMVGVAHMDAFTATAMVMVMVVMVM